MDFNIVIEADDKINDILKRSYDLGYECVAINTIVDSTNLVAKNINIPEPKYISFDGKFGRKFRILNRLTAVVEDPIHAHHLMKSAVTKKYDILAIQPVGEKIFQQVASQFDVDILCLNLSEDLGFSLKKTHIGLAFQKSICFEISYAPCLRSQTCKRSIISNAQRLVDVCKGKNIIISSGALRPLELRSPDDVANLGMLFNFKKNQAVEAVKFNGSTILSHAGTRKETGCGFVSLTGCLKIPKQQGWIVKVCKVPPLPTKTIKKEKRSLDDIENVASKKIKTEENDE